MPSFEDMQKLYQNIGTHGQQLKVMADEVMQQTFDTDIDTKQCYIYDYYHDDQFDEGLSGYNPALSKTKIPVKLKFIVKTYKSMAKDDPEYHIQFEPDVWNSMSCKPDWFANEYQKFSIDFPISLFVDIPDDRGIYQKWITCYKEEANQFPKFGVIKCNYLFTWVTDDGIHRHKRKMWGIERTQLSYTSGIWSGDKVTVFDDVCKWLLPWNPISSEIKHDQRMFVSMLQNEPYVYKVSKIKNTSPKGIITITAKQDRFNPNTDFVDNNPNSSTYGEMYADYYSSTVTPETQEDLSIGEHILSIEAKTYSVRIGGSKVLYAKIKDMAGNDITNTYDSSNLEWSFSMDGMSIENTLIAVDNGYRFKDEKNYYKCKFKFTGDELYLNKKIAVTLKIKNLTAKVDLEVVP